MSKVAWSKPIEWVFHDGSTEKAEFVGKGEAGTFHVETEYGPLYCDEYGTCGSNVSGHIRNVTPQVEQPSDPFLRDQFAMAALQGELAAQPENGEQRIDYNDDYGIMNLAKWCYLMADAMLEARKKGN